MPTVEIVNTRGETVGELELNPNVFDAEVNENLLFEVSQMHASNRRKGTASTKTRSEIRGGGRKPWRQKGTGRARHGTIRSPLWAGGGVVFGPKPRSYRYQLPRKMRRAAMRSALTSKLRSQELTVLNDLKLEEPKTRMINEILNNLDARGRVLLVTAGADENVYKSSRNIPRVNSAVANQINVYDVLNSDCIILTREAVARVEEVFAS